MHLRFPLNISLWNKEDAIQRQMMENVTEKILNIDRRFMKLSFFFLQNRSRLI